MKVILLQSILAATLCLLLSTWAPAAPAPRTPFFAMDTALSDAKSRAPAERAALLKELGYAGIGASGYLDESYLAAFDQQGLKIFNTYLTLSFDSAKPGLDPKLKAFVARLKGRDTALWVAINTVTRDGAKLKASDPAGDDLVVQHLRELAELAQASGVKIALYPHTWF
jgi:sugar phosphate isomerase/epimerase